MIAKVAGGQNLELDVRCRELDMRTSSVTTARALRSTRSCAWILDVEAPHAAVRSSSHSSMKAENWFQLRIVGVTAIREFGFGLALTFQELSSNRRALRERGVQAGLPTLPSGPCRISG